MEYCTRRKTQFRPGRTRGSWPASGDNITPARRIRAPDFCGLPPALGPKSKYVPRMGPKISGRPLVVLRGRKTTPLGHKGSLPPRKNTSTRGKKALFELATRFVPQGVTPYTGRWNDPDAIQNRAAHKKRWREHIAAGPKPNGPPWPMLAGPVFPPYNREYAKWMYGDRQSTWADYSQALGLAPAIAANLMLQHLARGMSKSLKMP